MTNYIYALHCPIANTIRYIGKSYNPQKRFKSHLSSAKTFAYRHHTSSWIRKLLAEGLQPEMRILEEVPDGLRWQEVERSWIAKGPTLGWKLTNSTAGGEGLDYICHEAAAAYRAKLSASHKIIWNTPERREEARQRSLDAWSDPEVTARRKASSGIARLRPETQARFVAAALEINSRPEVKAAKSAAIAAQWADPEIREMRLAATRTPEVKAAQSASKIALWKDPEFRAKQAARWDEEGRAHHAALISAPERQSKIRATCATPGYKAKRAATIRANTIAKKAARTPEQLALTELKKEAAKAKRAETARLKYQADKTAKLAATLTTPYTESS